jgi:multisite-specific tRNA:(cytosine-C5)-methyltransferase
MSKLVGEKLTVEGVEVQAFQQVPWYPNNLAYRLGCDRRMIRRDPALKQFHEWLQAHTESGSITRQEEVSIVHFVQRRVTLQLAR